MLKNITILKKKMTYITIVAIMLLIFTGLFLYSGCTSVKIYLKKENYVDKKNIYLLNIAYEKTYLLTVEPPGFFIKKKYYQSIRLPQNWKPGSSSTIKTFYTSSGNLIFGLKGTISIKEDLSFIDIQLKKDMGYKDAPNWQNCPYNGIHKILINDNCPIVEIKRINEE